MGAESMREIIRKMVQAHISRSVRPLPHVLTFLITPTIQSHEIWNLWPKWEVGKIEGSLHVEAWAGVGGSCCKVDANVCARPISVRL